MATKKASVGHAIKLTKPIVAKLRHDSAHGGYVWDSEEPGLGVRIYPSGRKSWILGYRPENSRRFKRHTLGDSSEFTLKGARQRARELKGHIVRGVDPVHDRLRARRAATVKEMGVRYLAHVKSHLKPSTAAEYKRLWEKHIEKALGSMKVAEVDTADVARLHRKIEAKYVANYAVNVVQSFFSFCAKEGVRPRGTNPAVDVKRHKEHRRERFLSAKEFATLGAVLIKAEKEGIPPAPKNRRETPSEQKIKHRTKQWDQIFPANPSAVACIRFLALTGLRRGEALNLRWTDLDLERSQIVLADSKTGKSIRPLSAAARMLIDSLPRRGLNVFSDVDGKPIASLKRIWANVTHAAELTGLRIHDLRHSFAAVSASGNDSMLILRNLLGHKTAEMTERYAHLAPDPVHAAANRVAGDIASWMSGAETVVTELRPKSAAV